MQVNVTQKHIEQGNPACPHCCPITLSIKQMGHPTVATRERMIIFDNSSVFLLPKVARLFVEAFDRGDPVEPISFQLEHEAIDDGKQPADCLCSHPVS